MLTFSQMSFTASGSRHRLLKPSLRGPAAVGGPRGSTEKCPPHPLVSVAIPAYNAALYLDEAIRSVVCQRSGGLEVLVIDDGSTDETKNVVTRYSSDPRVQYVYQDNRGLSSARNAGILKSRGKYISLPRRRRRVAPREDRAPSGGARI